MQPFRPRMPVNGPSLAQTQRVLRAPAPFDNLTERTRFVQAWNQVAADRDNVRPWDDPYTENGRWTPRAPSEVDYLFQEAARRGVSVFELPGLSYLVPPAALKGESGQGAVRQLALGNPRAWLELLVRNQRMRPPVNNDFGQDIDKTGIPAFIREGYDWINGYPKSEAVRRFMWARTPWNVQYEGVPLWHYAPVARHKWIERYVTEATAQAAAAQAAAEARMRRESEQEAAQRAAQAAQAARVQAQRQLEAQRHLIKPADFGPEESLAVYLGTEAKRLGFRPWQLPGLRYMRPPDSLKWFRDAVEKSDDPVAFFQMIADVGRRGSEYAAATSKVLQDYLAKLGFGGSISGPSPWHAGGEAWTGNLDAINAQNARSKIVDWIFHHRDFGGPCGPDPDARDGAPYRAGCTPVDLGLALTNYYTRAVGADAAERMVQSNARIQQLMQQALAAGNMQQAAQLQQQLVPAQQIEQQRQVAQSSVLKPTIERARAQLKQRAGASRQNTKQASQKVLQSVRATPPMQAKSGVESMFRSALDVFGQWAPWAGAGAGVLLGSWISGFAGSPMVKFAILAGFGVTGYLMTRSFIGGTA